MVYLTYNKYVFATFHKLKFLQVCSCILYLDPLVYVPIPLPIPHYFDYCSLVNSFKIGGCASCNFILLFQNLFSYKFHINFLKYVFYCYCIIDISLLSLFPSSSQFRANHIPKSSLPYCLCPWAIHINIYFFFFLLFKCFLY